MFHLRFDRPPSCISPFSMLLIDYPCACWWFNLQMSIFGLRLERSCASGHSTFSNSFWAFSILFDNVFSDCITTKQQKRVSCRKTKFHIESFNLLILKAITAGHGSALSVGFVDSFLFGICIIAMIFHDAQVSASKQRPGEASSGLNGVIICQSKCSIAYEEMCLLSMVMYRGDSKGKQQKRRREGEAKESKSTVDIFQPLLSRFIRKLNEKEGKEEV